VERLCGALAEQDAEIAVASDGKRMQPVYALLPVSLAASLQVFLASGERKIDRWYAGHRVALADLSDRPQGFANVNSEEDSRLLERELGR
jgi:molybdopterin-guanine dinucleotide biosynthesis protein A